MTKPIECPACKSREGFETTCVGYLGPDRNKIRCAACGEVGVVCDWELAEDEGGKEKAHQ